MYHYFETGWYINNRIESWLDDTCWQKCLLCLPIQQCLILLADEDEPCGDFDGGGMEYSDGEGADGNDRADATNTDVCYSYKDKGSTLVGG